MPLSKHNFHLFSGAMGGGKSTVLAEIRAAGFRCVAEPAREILAEQRLIQAPGVPEQNADLFCMLMLSRSIYNYNQHNAVTESLIFDRGIPDMIAYARLFGLDERVYINAANQFRYQPTLFFFPAWEEIYTTDKERKMSFEMAQAFGNMVREIYEGLGYRIREVPRVSLAERVKFILNNLD